MIFTIGHSNHSIDYFSELLKLYKIDTLVEVRSSPRSRFFPHFNQNNLKNTLQINGISYIDMGKTLGGRPGDKSVLNIDNEIELDKIESKDWYQSSIERLIEISINKNIVIMCSEENPEKCHRGYIITQSLLKRNIEVIHIRGDKTQQKAKDIANL
jgi:uncharacterized protein (DUF488 family)